jgi:hypothetical protein
MTTERSSFDDPGSAAGATGDDALGNVDALVGTREDTMASGGLSDAPSTIASEPTGSRKSSRQPTTASADRLQDAASNVADRVADTAQQQVGTRVEGQLGRGADILGQVSSAIRQSGEQLRPDQPQIAGFADTAADQVDRASQYLRQTDFQGLIRGAEDFARRQPAVFLGGALALGLVASRFLKASPSGAGQQGYRYSSGSGSYGSYGYGSYGAGGYGGSRSGVGSYGSTGMYGATAGSSGSRQANDGGELGTDAYGDATDAGSGSAVTSDQGAEHGGA